jgi:hypothetical protein
MFGFSRCQLVKFRRTNDMLNPAMAGAFTGAVLSSMFFYCRFGHSTAKSKAMLTKLSPFISIDFCFRSGGNTTYVLAL